MILFATPHDPTLNPKVLRKRRGGSGGQAGQLDSVEGGGMQLSGRELISHAQGSGLDLQHPTPNQTKTNNKKTMYVSAQELLFKFWKPSESLQTVEH